MSDGPKVSEKSPGRRQFLKTAASASALGAVAMTTAASAAEKPKHANVRGPMPTRTLGATGAQIPTMQLGTSQRLDQKYNKVLHRSLTSGVNGIDTALSYGWGSSHSARDSSSRARAFSSR
jgi:hypothetical protein